jgi:DNA (cytosine-5)-methyltransferase 1
MLKHDTDYKPTGLAPTLTTELSHHTGKNFTPKIIREIEYANNEILKRKMCNDLIKQGEVEEGDIVKHSYTSQILNGNKKCVEKNDGNMITLTTRGDCVGVCVKGIATNESEDCQKQPLEEKSRTLLANKSNAGVGVIDTDLRIRKLTPKECFRLMGVKDEDFEKVRKNQSDSSLYHLAGDSIVVDVLCHIFAQLIGGDEE